MWGGVAGSDGGDLIEQRNGKITRKKGKLKFPHLNGKNNVGMKINKTMPVNTYVWHMLHT